MLVVLDTNIVVSGLLQPFGPSGQIVRLVAAGEIALAFDARILGEYREVLLREKFSFDPSRVEALLDEIRVVGQPVSARPLAIRLPDLDDEAFLEVALAAQAECLVTGNVRHFPLEARQGVEVLVPRDLVDRLR